MEHAAVLVIVDHAGDFRLDGGGTGIRKLATLHNVGTGTVQRIKDAIASHEAA